MQKSLGGRNGEKSRYTLSACDDTQPQLTTNYYMLDQFSSRNVNHMSSEEANASFNAEYVMPTEELRAFTHYISHFPLWQKYGIYTD